MFGARFHALQLVSQPQLSKPRARRIELKKKVTSDRDRFEKSDQMGSRVGQVFVGRQLLRHRLERPHQPMGRDADGTEVSQIMDGYADPKQDTARPGQASQSLVFDPQPHILQRGCAPEGRDSPERMLIQFG